MDYWPRMYVFKIHSRETPYWSNVCDIIIILIIIANVARERQVRSDVRAKMRAKGP
jgi:hypothetical protein